MSRSKVPRCASCGQKIRSYEPDLLLEDYRTGRERFYHTRCGEAAFTAVEDSPPGLYRITRRYVDASRN